MSANGTRPLSTNAAAPFPNAFVIASSIGLIMLKARTARPQPKIPSEKLSYNISKPSGILSCNLLSTCLSIQAAAGPMAIAPRNCGEDVATIIAVVTTAPITPPL